MTKDAFHQNLVEAARGIIEATREFVTDALPDDARFLIVPNCSFDGNPLEDDEEVYPEDSIPNRHTKPPMKSHEVVADLYRNGKVPEWINVYVDSSDDEFTFVRLECCGRFTAMDAHLYHVGGGIPPFSILIKMPSLEYELETHGKFRLRA